MARVLGVAGRLAVGACLAILVATVGPARVAAAAPSNDDFSAAATLAPAGGTASTITLDATTQLGEPAHAGDDGGASVWFSWTPSISGRVQVATSASDFDTLLAVYAGSGLGSLTPIATNDDVRDDSDLSRTCFSVVAGQAYMIAVDGYQGEEGTTTLSWGPKTGSEPCPGIAPQITEPGTGPRVGGVLSTTTGVFVDPGPTTSRQWLRCSAGLCRSIAGATGSSYTLSAGDVGFAIRVDVESSSSAGVALNASPPTAVVGMTASTHANGRIYFQSGTSYDMFSTAADGTDLRPLGDFPGFYPTVPVPSPDGARIAFAFCCPPGSSSTLSLIDADGSNAVDTGLPMIGYPPTWSPDGSRIAFIAGIVNDVGVVIADADGSDAHFALMTTWPATIYGVDWSPDGTKLAVSYDPRMSNTTAEIAVIAADGRGPLVALTSSDWTEMAPAWSPDGSKIAYLRKYTIYDDPTDSLWVMDADGSNKVQVSIGPINAVDWSPDGASLVIGRRDGDYSGQSYFLYTVPATGGPVAPLPVATGDPANPRWSVAISATGGGGGTGGGNGGGGGGLAADLYVTGSVEPVNAPVGGTLTWRLQVLDDKNRAAAAGVFVDVALPAGVQVASASADRGPGCAAAGVGRLRCNLDWLSGDAQRANVTIVTNVPQAGELVLTATAGHSRTDLNPADNTITLRANTPPPPTPSPPARTPSAGKGVTRTGSARSDTLFGTAYADVLRGLGGNDRIYGKAGTDRLYGGSGNDTILGGAGLDLIDGGAGSDRVSARDGQRDTIRCGAGSDTVAADKKDSVSVDCEIVKRV